MGSPQDLFGFGAPQPGSKKRRRRRGEPDFQLECGEERLGTVKTKRLQSCCSVPLYVSNESELKIRDQRSRLVYSDHLGLALRLKKIMSRGNRESLYTVYCIYLCFSPSSHVPPCPASSSSIQVKKKARGSAGQVHLVCSMNRTVKPVHLP